MPKLELSPAEAELLREMAEEWLNDLREKIGCTEGVERREQLKWRESLMCEVLERLGAPVTVPSG